MLVHLEHYFLDIRTFGVSAHFFFFVVHLLLHLFRDVSEGIDIESCNLVVDVLHVFKVRSTLQGSFLLFFVLEGDILLLVYVLLSDLASIIPVLFD